MIRTKIECDGCPLVLEYDGVLPRMQVYKRSGFGQSGQSDFCPDCIARERAECEQALPPEEDGT